MRCLKLISAVSEQLLLSLLHILKKNEAANLEKEKICVIKILGSINAKMADQVITNLNKAQTDDAVKCVILRIDSRGGSAIASEAIYSYCKHLSKVSIMKYF